MSGTELKNLRVFEKLCGEDFSRIVLVTTMWDEVEREMGELRETQLKYEHWKTLIDRGSSIRQFYCNQKSAFDILAPFIDEANQRSTLRLQTEMNDLGLKLEQTGAARALCSKFEDLVARHQKITQMIRNEMTDPTLDPEQLEVLMKDYKKVSMQLKRANEDLNELKISVGERIESLAKSIRWTRTFR